MYVYKNNSLCKFALRCTVAANSSQTITNNGYRATFYVLSARNKNSFLLIFVVVILNR